MTRPVRIAAGAHVLALAVVLSLAAADPRPRPAAVDVTRPASAAVKLSQSLKALYESVDRARPTSEEVGPLAATLTADLKQVAALDAEIGKLGPGVADRELKETALRHRALAWLHGWAAFARLAEAAARADTAAGRHADALLAVGRPDPSALDLLLAVYQQVAAAEGQPDPLRRRLADPAEFVTALGFRKPWGTDPRPDYLLAGHRDFVPATADLIGSPADAPEPDGRGLLSLWRLVNLQLDTWRGAGPADAGPDLGPVAGWLEKLSYHPALADPAAAVGPPAEGLSWKLYRLARFADARTRLRDPQVLDAAAAALKADRDNGKPCEHPLVRQLAQATGLHAGPNAAESLPAAGVWLRYVFLLSYRGEGALVVAGDADNSPARYWQKCRLPGEFAADPAAGKPESAAAVRWDHAPAAGHFDRAVRDTVRGADGYLRWEAGLPALEKQRFAVLTGGDPKAFVAALGDHLGGIDDLDRDHLAAHVPRRTDYWVASRDNHPLLGDPAARPGWDRQASAGERQRLRAELAAVAGQARGMADLQRAVRTAYAAPPAAGPPALRGLATHLGGAEWDVTAVPEKSFAAYQKDLKDALDGIDKALAAAQRESELRDRYAVRRDEADVRELEYAAARLGVVIAAKGQEMAALLKRAADLEVEVARLADEANGLLKLAEGKGAAAAGKRLALAQRTRDLAAAQVDALLAAQDKAAEIVAQAVKDLDALRPKLEDIAQKIEDSKKASFLSILKAVVKVVAVALAPFTGGASLAIGTAVDQALTIADKLGQINWDNPLQALGQLGAVIEDVGKLGDLVVGQWGNADMKKGWADVKGWVKDRQADVTKVGADGKQFLDHLQKLAPAEFRKAVAPLAAAAHLDLPVEFDPKNGTIKVDLGKAGVKLKPDALGKALQGLLDGGGAVAADAKARVERWGHLAGLDDARLKTDLPKAVDELVAVLPPGLQKDVAGANAAVDEAKRKLKEVAAAADAGAADARRLLAQTLAGHLVVVLDAGGAVAVVERTTAAEIAKTKARLGAYKAKVQGRAVADLVASIKGKSDALSAVVNAAQEAKDENRLREIARGPNGVTATVAAVQGELEKFKQEVDLARGELADAETKVEIDTLLEGAAVARKQWADKLGEGTLLGKEVAALRAQAAGLEKEVRDLEAARKGVELEAAARRREAARAAVGRTYSDCLRWGFNPQSGEPEADLLPGLAGVLRVRAEPAAGGADPDRLRRAATAAVGMLRWVRLVGQAGAGDGGVNALVTGHYTTVVNLATGGQPAAAVREKLGAVADDLAGVVGRVTLPDPYWVRGNYPAAGGGPAGPRVEWLTAPLRTGDRDLTLADVPAEYRSRVLGRMRVLAAPVVPPAAAGYGGYELTADPAKAYYAFPARARVICPKTPLAVVGQLGDYEFLVVPPPVGRLPGKAADRLAPATAAPEPKKIAESIPEALLLESLKTDLPGLWTGKVQVWPADGVWRVYVLGPVLKDAPADPEVWRADLAAKWEREGAALLVRIPFAAFPSPK